jgi:hypothetical protein
MTTKKFLVVQGDKERAAPSKAWAERQARLGKKLRQMREDIEAEPIPSRFARLLGLPPDRPPPTSGGSGARVPHYDDDGSGDRDVGEKRVGTASR